jgi:hypothetical protein
LFCRQGEHRKQFNHYFDYHIRHFPSRRHPRIDLQTIREILQALEKVKQRIVARRNPTGSLPRSYIIRKSSEGQIRGTYSKERVNSGKQYACW